MRAVSPPVTTAKRLGDGFLLRHQVSPFTIRPGRAATCGGTSFHAALEAPWEQISLWVMAWMTRLGLVKDWSRHVSLFSAMSEKLITFGSVKGGMHIQLIGESSDGQPAAYTWFLTADDNHGPEIPCTPSIVLVKKLLRNELNVRGAYACHGFFALDEIMDEFSDFTISSEIVAEAES